MVIRLRTPDGKVLAIPDGSILTTGPAAPTGPTDPTNVAPVAAFTAAPPTELTVEVDGSDSTDLGGTITAWSWAWGDGTTSTGVTASHTYAAAGTYKVTLTVTDDQGATDTTSQQVTVTAPVAPNTGPTAAFTTDVFGMTVDVDATGSTDPDGTITGYAWNFGDDTTSTGVTASHTYTTPGTYTITLTATDDAGATGTATDTATAQVTVSDTLANGTFDTSTAGWTAGANTTIARTTLNPHSGMGALRLTAVAAGEAKAASDPFTVDPTKRYTFTAMVRTAATSRPFGLQIDWYSTTTGAHADYLSSTSDYRADSTTWGAREVPEAQPPAGAVAARISLVVPGASAGEVHYADTITAQEVEAAPDTGGGGTETVIVDDHFNRSVTIDSAIRSNPAEPFWWPEYDSWPYVISGGTMKRTGNTGFDRLFSKFRFGGPGTAVRFRWRARITTYHNDNGWSGHRGLKIGMKFPSPNSTYGKDDILSVGTVPSPGGGSYTKGQAASYAPVVAFSDQGDYEFITLGYDTRNYIGFHSAPGTPAPAGVWLEKSQEIAWLPNGTVRCRMWNNATLSGTPAYEKTVTGEEVFADKGYFWARLDYVDTEWDYLTITQVPT